MFTTKEMLHRKIVRLASDEALRMDLGNNLKNYLDTVVSWEVVTRQYDEAYELAQNSAFKNQPVVLPPEF